jgi:hypothetical protein
MQASLHALSQAWKVISAGGASRLPARISLMSFRLVKTIDISGTRNTSAAKISTA